MTYISPGPQPQGYDPYGNPSNGAPAPGNPQEQGTNPQQQFQQPSWMSMFGGGNSPYNSPGQFQNPFGGMGGMFGGMGSMFGGMGGMANKMGGAGLTALQGLGGGGMNMLGGMGGMGMNMLGALPGMASGAMGGLGGLAGGIGGAMSAMGPMGMGLSGLLGGMIKQKTWNPTDVMSGGLKKYGADLGNSSNSFLRGVGKTMGNLGNLQSNLVGSKGVAGKMWDSSIGALGKGIGKIFSDVSLKENVQLIGKSPTGVNVYEFDYKDKSYGSGRYQGVMAHEVPWASERARNGYLRVDYTKVDVNFTTANK